MAYVEIPVRRRILDDYILNERFNYYKKVYEYNPDFIIPKNIEILLFFNKIDINDDINKRKILFLCELLKKSHNDSEDYNQQLRYYLRRIGRLKKKNDI